MKAYMIPVGIAAAGMILLAVCDRTPRYQDPGWARRVHEGNAQEFFQARDENVTAESKLWHLGAGLAALGLTLGVGFALLEVDEVEELLTLGTPARKLTFFILANVTWLAFIPAQNHWASYTQLRGDYPWWSDTTVASMIGNTLMITFGLPLINAGLALCLSGADLPAPLRSAPQGFWPWVATVLAAVLGIMAAPALVRAVVDGNAFAVPLWCSILYLLLAARAAASSGQEREVTLTLPTRR